MKKNLLFIIPSLTVGGGERSLVNLLSVLEWRHYQVDLLLLHQEGTFVEYLPKEVNVLPLPDCFRTFSLPFSQSIISFIRKGKHSFAFDRFKFMLLNRSHLNTSQKEQKGWKYISKSLDILDKEYDVAIGYLEKTATYYCVDKVKAKKKIGWVHTDYNKLGAEQSFDLSYFKKLTHIVTVSEKCASILAQSFPTEKEKINVIYNINSPFMIHKAANQKVSVKKTKNETFGKTIVSVGRLHKEKGFEMVIEASRLLVEKGYVFKWKIIGDGPENSSLQKLINKHQLEDYVQLMGLQANPYPFIKQADIYAQTSKYEGKSIAIDEAKILFKPILVTNFETASDQITHERTGLIVEMNPVAIAIGIERLMNEPELSKSFIHFLQKEPDSIKGELAKFYELIEGVNNEEKSFICHE
ncbi:putative glycosyltransferase [Bacillus sp. TS-2]|nr:putative glycosyltransferase [Bacillus sp. TS-2]